jgi:hypothetical protein
VGYLFYKGLAPVPRPGEKICGQDGCLEIPSDAALLAKSGIIARSRFATLS